MCYSEDGWREDKLIRTLKLLRDSGTGHMTSGGQDNYEILLP